MSNEFVTSNGKFTTAQINGQKKMVFLPRVTKIRSIEKVSENNPYLFEVNYDYIDYKFADEFFKRNNIFKEVGLPEFHDSQVIIPFPKELQESVERKGRLFGNNAEFKRWMKNLYSKCPLYVRPIIYIIGRYIFMGGFLDGYAGWYWHTRQGLKYRMLVDKNIAKLRKEYEA